MSKVCLGTAYSEALSWLAVYLEIFDISDPLPLRLRESIRVSQSTGKKYTATAWRECQQQQHSSHVHDLDLAGCIEQLPACIIARNLKQALHSWSIAEYHPLSFRTLTSVFLIWFFCLKCFFLIFRFYLFFVSFLHTVSFFVNPWSLFMFGNFIWFDLTRKSCSHSFSIVYVDLYDSDIDSHLLMYQISTFIPPSVTSAFIHQSPNDGDV